MREFSSSEVRTAYLFMVVESLRVVSVGEEKETLAGASVESLDS